MLHAAQIRAARALLDWRQERLAEAADVGVSTIRRIEGRHGIATGNVSTLMRIQTAFERAGVRFIDTDALGGVGVRLELVKSKRKGQKS
jgi:transcriptional regulator with XRE-family HTH domain